MALQDFIDDIPDDKREAFKAEIDGVAVIRSREDAQKLFDTNSFIKSERDALISRTTETYARKFQDEKLPGLLDAEYKKRHPDADPKDLALQSVQKELADMKRQAIIKDRKATATARLAEMGLPTDLADFAIDEDETSFGSKLEKLAGLKAWSEGVVKKALGEKMGNQGNPKAGKSAVTMTLDELNNLSPKARSEFFAKGGQLTD